MNHFSVEEQPSMSGSHWTREQWQAITARGKNILVAAAAGSGKTAVLVNRMIQRIMDEEEGLDVDRLLVVTFTNAAAAEMRNRIGAALEKELKVNPGSVHLQRQLNLLPRASISTLHSFCLEVVRRYYYQLELDPHFRIADETEALLLREEVIQALFEEEYSKENKEEFYALVDRYSSDRSDLELQELVLRLYDFSRSHPWPEEWLAQMAASYQQAEEENCSLSDFTWTNVLLVEIERELHALLDLSEKALELAKQPNGPFAYIANLEAEREMVEQLWQACKAAEGRKQGRWEDVYTAFQTITFGRLKPIKKGEVDPKLQEWVKALRDQIKNQLKTVQETYFLRSPDDYLQDIREMAPYMHGLIELVGKFSRRYEQMKRERLLVDFADLEHYCLQILAEPVYHPSATGRGQTTALTFLPTAAAEEYRAKFKEVLVDEYQDTNLVQEAIIQMVSHGNLFMVGDVKQSIYRFRLAEPSLFLEKYKAFTPITQLLAHGSELASASRGVRIDLAKNFRSRPEVLAGTNFIFRQVMDEAVGEMNYGKEEELVFGAEDYPESEACAAELLLIHRSEAAGQVEREDDEMATESDVDEDLSQAEDVPLALEELETVQLEARLLAQKINALVGQTSKPFLVYDKNQQCMRPATYRDIVILLRSTSNWAPVILEELKAQGIPAYAELQSGYFEAIEVKVMLSLLQVIDNPEQDIPLAAVLRSPIVGLTGEELAQIRLRHPKASFFEAVKAYLGFAGSEQTSSLTKPDERLKERLARFYEQLGSWRTKARQGPLAELIWQIYRDTGYYDFVSGLAGGNQRQANLRALYDRARQYEQTSFRGLFRFLRFIEKLRDSGNDLGTARALGEQEDVVRVMTIHKSKGLEFPIVFVAGLAKQFNQRDLSQKFLLHKELGLGTKFVDPVLRVSYTSLPQLAIKQRLHMELLAEEMRILYVALTRAKEKLFLVGTLNDLEKAVERWREQHREDAWLLPDYARSKAKSYLDWIGPALLRHQAGRILLEQLGKEQEMASLQGIAQEVYHDPARWQISLYEASQFQEMADLTVEQQEEWLKALRALKPIAPVSPWREELERRLTWEYAHPLAVRYRAKQSVTELKRQREARDEATDDHLIRRVKVFRSPLVERPRFLQKQSLTAAEIGTAMHLVMQHINVAVPVTIESIQAQIEQLIEKELLTAEQANALAAEDFYPFFQSPLGQRMQEAAAVHREIPFSLAVPAEEAYSEWQSANAEKEYVLVQGVIDAVFEERSGGVILVDYKSDQVAHLLEMDESQARETLKKRYQVQIELYERALEQIWKRKVTESYVYFFKANYALAMD